MRLSPAMPMQSACAVDCCHCACQYAAFLALIWHRLISQTTQQYLLVLSVSLLHAQLSTHAGLLLLSVSAVGVIQPAAASQPAGVESGQFELLLKELQHMNESRVHTNRYFKQTGVRVSNTFKSVFCSPRVTACNKKEWHPTICNVCTVAACANSRALPGSHTYTWCVAGCWSPSVLHYHGWRRMWGEPQHFKRVCTWVSRQSVVQAGCG